MKERMRPAEPSGAAEGVPRRAAQLGRPAEGPTQKARATTGVMMAGRPAS